MAVVNHLVVVTLIFMNIHNRQIKIYRYTLVKTRKL